MSTTDRRAELAQKLAQLDTEDARKAALSPAQRVAEALHGKSCHYNHTDGCDWYYRTWEESQLSAGTRHSGSRPDYLRKAEALLAAMHGDEQAILTVLKHL